MDRSQRASPLAEVQEAKPPGGSLGRSLAYLTGADGVGAGGGPAGSEDPGVSKIERLAPIVPRSSSAIPG